MRQWEETLRSFVEQSRTRVGLGWEVGMGAKATDWPSLICPGLWGELDSDGGRTMRRRARLIGWLAFGVGLALGLIGYITDVYSGGTATALMLGVWLVGGVLAALIPVRESIVTGREAAVHIPADVRTDPAAERHVGGF